MNFILCALLACCVPTCPTSMYDWDSCGISSIPPVSTQAGCGSTDPAKCGGAAVPGRGCAPADDEKMLVKRLFGEVAERDPLRMPHDEQPTRSGPPALSSTTPGLWELRCEVDTVEGRWVHGERWENLPCPDVSNQKRQDGYVIGATVEVCAAIHGKFVTDSTWITDDPVIDTTCVWERHECAGLADSVLVVTPGHWDFEWSEGVTRRIDR